MNIIAGDRIKTRFAPMLFKAVSGAGVTLVLLSVSTIALGQDQPKGGDLVHAVGGVVTRVDSATKTIAVKLADGTEQVFKYSTRTTVHASAKVAKGARIGSADTYMAGKEGTHVVVRYTGEGADRTAVAVDDFGKDGLKFSQGTVSHVDKAARTVTVKGEDGTERTYDIAKDATVDTEHGVVKGLENTAKEGEHVTVHYSDEAGKKVAHLIRRI